MQACIIRNDDVKRTDIICFSIMMKKLKDNFFFLMESIKQQFRGASWMKREQFIRYAICSDFSSVVRVSCSSCYNYTCKMLVGSTSSLRLSCFPGIIRGIPKRIMHMS